MKFVFKYEGTSYLSDLSSWEACGS